MTFYSAREMFQACSTVQEKFPMLSVIAIPWLHGTNSREMAHRIEGGGGWPTLLFLMGRIGVCVLRGFQWAFLIGFLKFKTRKEFFLLKQRSLVGIIKTWFVNPPKKKERQDDFYFGNLQGFFKDQGLSTLLLCGNVTCKAWSSFCDQTTKVSDLPRLPDLCLVSPFHTLWLMCCQIAVSFLLFGASLFEKDHLVRRVLKLASCDCMRAQTMLGALHFWMGRLAAKIWRPKFFITLYEGHGWEQCLWRGIRSQDPACRIVGYQHTVIMSHNFETMDPRASRHEKTTPDIVLTMGYRGCEILKEAHAKFGTKIIPFGSFRYSPEMKALEEPDEKRRSILVIPEGIWEEALFLFETVAKLAPILKGHRFILRCHPVLPFTQLRARLKNDPTQFSNVELSNGRAIEEDFSRSGVAIYRGSSAVLFAILKGLKPFYLNGSSLKKIDPLFELKEWKEEVDSLKALYDRIQNFYATPRQIKKDSWKAAVQYVQDYTIPVDERSIQRLLTTIQ